MNSFENNQQQTLLPSVKELSGDFEQISSVSNENDLSNLKRKRSSDDETSQSKESKKDYSSLPTNHDVELNFPLKGAPLLPEKNEQFRPLLVEPESLEGVASAYRYKLTILNRELYGCVFNFTEDADVFSFQDVNKKRAVKKEDWPTDASPDNPSIYDVKVQLMAGNVEIKNCSGCSMWKDLTEKPILILTPQGNRCIQFVRKPFILVIFRCCPKFHSFAKQFKLNIIVTCRSTGVKYSTVINIFRKKMRQTKSKVESVNVANYASKSPNPIHPREFAAYQQHFNQYQQYQPQLLTQQVNSPQLLYDILYNQKNQNPNAQSPSTTPSLPFPPVQTTMDNKKLNNQQYSNQQQANQTIQLSKITDDLPLSSKSQGQSKQQMAMPSPSDEKWLETFLDSRMTDRSVPRRSGS